MASAAAAAMRILFDVQTYECLLAQETVAEGRATHDAFYKASTPTRPNAAPRPMPYTAVGRDAPPDEEDVELVDPELEPAEDEAPVDTLDPVDDTRVVLLVMVLALVVELEPAVELLVWRGGMMVLFPYTVVAFAMDVAPVPAAEVTFDAPVTTGSNRDWMSLGKAVNQAGVDPAANSETT